MSKPWRIFISAAVALLLAVGVWQLYQSGYTLEQLEKDLSEAPAWLFILSLALLPAFGVPLTLFMLLVGARFGMLYGSLIASAAVFGHHLIAVGLSSVARKLFGENEKGRQLWEQLEKKVGKDHTGKLVFLFGFIPGPPYLIKLYLPLAMGVSGRLFVLASASAHLFGVVLFVGLGGALLRGNPMLILAFFGGIVALTLGLHIFKRRHAESSKAEAANQA